MEILLIAGHGQGDPGACGCGYKEAELTREVVALLSKQLSKVIRVTVFDTTQNLYKFLKSGEHYNFKPFDYVLEVHFNAGVNNQNGNGQTTGTEILVHPSEKGISVEQKIVDNLAKLGFKNRGVKGRSNLLNMNVCKGKQGVSYGLLEVCFIDDGDDMKLYSNKKEQIISAIANGITEGFGFGKIPNANNKTIILTSANDIAWELNHTYFPIIEIRDFVKALDEAKKNNSPLYWGYYKLVNHM